jgi:ABC-type antimicrobial peptide transport system permease subunit
MVFGLILAVLLLPNFNTLSGKDMSLSTILTWKFITGLFAITLITGIISGSYPALFLSAFQPAKVLKGSLREGTKSALFRKTLVVIQFTLSVLLIIGTSIVFKQLHFMRTKKLGFDKEHLICSVLRGDTHTRYETLKNQLLVTPGVENVTATWQYPLYNSANAGGADWEGKDPEQTVLIGINGVDFDYVETIKIEMADGRSFSKKFSTDTSSAFMVNEEVAKLIGRDSVVGERFSFAGTDGYIIGVMKNYHFKTLRDEIEPHALVLSPGQYRFAVIRLDEGNIVSAVDNIKQTWNHVNPGYPFEYSFLDEDYDQMYRSEERIGKLLQTFAVLAIFIASLGLFGLASYTAEQRTKEIGVRKVLGATVPSIALLLSREFTKWVIVSNLIAWPVSFFLLKNWLQSFAYRTSLSWWIFGLSGFMALIIALLTVSFQAVKAALANPANSLKYE